MPPTRAPSYRAAQAALLLAVASSGSCGCRSSAPPPPDSDADAEPPPWQVAPSAPEPRPGMVWIPPGALVAGTPPEKLPRVADEEMAGEQVMMRGFYIDLHPHPNEPGAIPTTNMSRDEARGLCEATGKRLCTELELERACKGPTNSTYPYGETYRASVCGTGSRGNLVPNGYHAGCRSAFGVHDLHGSVWTWTASEWRRDASKPGRVSVRGGNGTSGELVGRCANGRAVRPEAQMADLGVRCCAGEPNSFEVVLSVVRGDTLKWHPPDESLAPQLAELVPPEVTAATPRRRAAPFQVERMWTWRPLGNEELVLGGGCAGERREASCGIVVARTRHDGPVLLAFVSTDIWQPTVSAGASPRELHVIGGDESGAFRRRVTYEWGRIVVAEKERKRRRKGKDLGFD